MYGWGGVEGGAVYGEMLCGCTSDFLFAKCIR